MTPTMQHQGPQTPTTRATTIDNPEAGRINPGRFFILLYGLVSYAAFLAVFLYAVGFIGNFAVPSRWTQLPQIRGQPP
jgi:hypothetical protein